jgi:hypothetical protein
MENNLIVEDITTIEEAIFKISLDSTQDKPIFSVPCAASTEE